MKNGKGENQKDKEVLKIRRDGEGRKEQKGEKKRKKHSKERENRPSRLAAQLPHDFDLRNR